MKFNKPIKKCSSDIIRKHRKIPLSSLGSFELLHSDNGINWNTTKEINDLIHVAYYSCSWCLIFSYLEYQYSMEPTYIKAKYLIDNFLHDDNVLYSINIQSKDRDYINNLFYNKLNDLSNDLFKEIRIINLRDAYRNWIDSVNILNRLKDVDCIFKFRFLKTINKLIKSAIDVGFNLPKIDENLLSKISFTEK